MILRLQAREARRSAPRLALALLSAIVCAAAIPSPAAAQSLRGRVERAGQGVAGAAIELHRVSRTARGVVASGTSDAAGEFALSLPPVDTAGGFTVYFATATVDGVRYFGPAIHPDQSAERYRVAVYDTTSSPAAADSVRVSRRDVFLIPELDGGWEVAEMVRVRNTARRTVLADQRPVFGLGLPAGIDAFEAGESGMDSARATQAGVARVGDRAWVTDALLPGDRDFFFRYRLPARVRSTALPFVQGADTVVLYVRQPAPELEVTGMPAGAPWEAQGERFIRYVATGVRPGARIGLDWGGPAPAPVDPRWAALAIAAAILGAGAVLAIRRGG